MGRHSRVVLEPTATEHELCPRTRLPSWGNSCRNACARCRIDRGNLSGSTWKYSCSVMCMPLPSDENSADTRLVWVLLPTEMEMTIEERLGLSARYHSAPPPRTFLSEADIRSQSPLQSLSVRETHDEGHHCNKTFAKVWHALRPGGI